MLSEAVAADAAAAAAQPAAAPALEILADIDVAAVMGLMPDTRVAMPGWYDEYVGEQLLALAVSGPAWPAACRACCACPTGCSD